MKVFKKKQDADVYPSVESLTDRISNCNYRNLGEIDDLWGYFKNYLSSEFKLGVYKEIVLLDPKESGGRDLIETFYKTSQDFQSKINNITDSYILVVFIDNKDCVAKSEIIEAKPETSSQLETILKEYNGILRIIG